MAGLDDPYSFYYNPKEYKEMMDNLKSKELVETILSTKGVLDIVINDPLDFGVIEDVRIVTGYKPKAFSATLQEIDAAIEK